MISEHLTKHIQIMLTEEEFNNFEKKREENGFNSRSNFGRYVLKKYLKK